MNGQKQKSPYSLAAGTGFSENIHQQKSANNQYHNMISNNPDCQRFCAQLLERFDGLLERFSPNSPHVYQGRELDAFIALVNLERSIDAPHYGTEVSSG
ncbi:MAG: hypothetical protein ACI9SP_003124 [Arenicella sp.]|jgi:hypothetical protein